MIEKLQNSNDLYSSINYLENGNKKENTINYLNQTNDNQIRELYSLDKQKITAEEGIQISNNFKYHEIKIYNQLTDNLTKEDLHNMAIDIIEARNKQGGGKITGFYAIHQRPDGSNKHLHIVYLSNDKKALDKTGRGNEWQKIRTKIELKYTKNDIEKEKVIEYYNKALQTLKSKLTGTEKIDRFILTHMNKENGNFGLKRALISIQKSKSIKNKKYYIKRLTGRLNSLEKQGIVQKVNDNTYKVDIEKFNKMIEERAKEKIEKNKIFDLNTQLKYNINDIKEKKLQIQNLKKISFEKFKTSSEYEKISVLYELEEHIEELKHLDIAEKQLKLEILDNRLMAFGQINIEKEKEFFKKTNPTLDDKQISKILNLKIKRLEQLVKKDLIEKNENEYTIKDKQKFAEYIRTNEANIDRNELAIKHSTYNKEYIFTLRKQTNLKITINALKRKEKHINAIQKLNMKQLKQLPAGQKKEQITKDAKKTLDEKNKLKILENKNKMELLDIKLLNTGSINLEKEREFLKRKNEISQKFTSLKFKTHTEKSLSLKDYQYQYNEFCKPAKNKLNEKQIDNILKIKYERLEQLVEKGLVEKKDNEYIIKDKQQFKEYIKSKQADKDRTELAEKNISQSKYIDFLDKDNKLKIKLQKIKAEKNILNQNNYLFTKRYKKTYDKKIYKDIEKNIEKIHELNIKENEIKIAILDNKLKSFGIINIEKQKNFLRENTNLTPEQIEKSLKIETERLEQLAKKGLVEKKGNEYIVKDKQKFSEYIKTNEANADIKTIATKNTPSLENLKKEFKLQIKIYKLYNKQTNLIDTNKTNFSMLSSPFSNKTAKKVRTIYIKQTLEEINKLKIEETKIKLELVDQKLLTHNRINPYSGAEYLLKNTILSTQKIREITELQLKRLEQLKRKGLVEKKGNEYIVKDKQKFKEYIKSEKADKDRTRIAKLKITNKTIKTKVNTFINKHSKVRPIRDFKSSYYNLSRIFGKTTGDRLLAFGIALGYSIAKNSIKLAFKIAISTVRTIIGTTSKTIKFSKNKTFERKIKKQKKNKPVTRKTQQNNKLTKNTDTLKKETKEQNKKTIEEILNREKEEKNIEKSHTSSSKSR